MASPKSAKDKYSGHIIPCISVPPSNTVVPEEISAKAKKIITRGKLRLLKHRFIGSMFLTFRDVIEHPGIPTYATDMINCYYNPFTVVKETTEDCVASLAHETMHKILRHGMRAPKGKYDHKTWNCACDYALDAILKDEGFHLDPDLFLYNPEWHGLPAEVIYKKLMDNPSQMPEEVPIHVFHPAQTDPETGETKLDKDGNPVPAKLDDMVGLDASIDSQIINAHEANKQFGLKSQALKDLIKDLKENKVSWEDVIFRTAMGTVPEDFTWNRPNRRYIGLDIYLPSMLKRGVGTIYIWPDSSGSMSRDKEIPAIYSEMKYILERMMPEKTVIVNLDSAIHQVKEYYRGDVPEELDYIGGGGTDPKPFFKYIEEQGDCHMAVCLTDMCFDHNIPEPNYPVIWASTMKTDEIPFGTLIHIDMG